MGVGKTVLVSNVVAQLHTARKPNDIISYFFCRSDNEELLSARNILGSLARQLVDTQVDQAENDDLETLHKVTQDLDTSEVTDFLLSHLMPDKNHYLILDGLDECDDRAIRAVA